MRPAPALLLAALAAAPAPARAQRATRAISLEAAVSSPVRAPAVAAALGASWWLDGDLHATARLAWAVAGETGGRGVTGAVGLAWAPGTSRLRPRAFVEAGWARRRFGAWGSEARAALGAGVGLEWFFRREVALTAGVAARRTHASSLELFGGVRAGF
jgi:hypothetical protein